MLSIYRYAAAETDCLTTLTLDPLYIKAHLRLGAARAGQNKLPEAKEVYEKILLLEPQNKQAKIEIQKIEKVNCLGLIFNIILLEYQILIMKKKRSNCVSSVKKPSHRPTDKYILFSHKLWSIVTSTSDLHTVLHWSLSYPNLTYPDDSLIRMHVLEPSLINI